MAQQEEGWPLGLQPLNVGVGSATNDFFSGSASFNTLVTGSPVSSTDSSSGLDTESTGSFFHDRSITLGSLIGVSSILELSKRSVRAKNTESSSSKDKKSYNKSKTWLFSLCSRDTTDAAEDVNNPLSLGHFLAVERKSANDHRTNQSPLVYGLDELAMAHPESEPNSLFVDGRVAPPRASSYDGSNFEIRSNGGLDEHHHGVPVLFSCMCGQPSH